MLDYIKNLRNLVGNIPLILCPAGVIILENKKRVLLQHRTDNNTWGIPGG
jgi:8-oxo-dGTP pyrophosphatase MutT (NUDIX family)